MAVAEPLRLPLPEALGQAVTLVVAEPVRLVEPEPDALPLKDEEPHGVDVPPLGV